MTKLSEESGYSKPCIYGFKKEFIEYLKLQGERPDLGKCTSITIDKKMIERMVVGFMMYGAVSTQGVVDIFECVFGIRISTGKVSGIINEAARRAQEFDDSIDLGGIKQGANDEIYQGATPIATGVDPVTGYAYLLEEMSDRTGETWSAYFELLKDQGLALETSINDGGAGLISGVTKAFPEADIQRDVFHELRSVGREVSKAERQACSLIAEEAKLEERVKSPRAKKETSEKLKDIRPKVEKAIKQYDILFILFGWLRIFVGFSGYNYEETTALIHFTLDEIIKNAVDYPKLKVAAVKFKVIVPSLLSFVNRLDKEFEKIAAGQKLSLDALKEMYRQLTFSPNARQHHEIECGLAMKLLHDYDRTRAAFQSALVSVKRASSMVENLNGRIRKYMNIKRTVPTRFFVLMKVYFNTKRSSRSRCPERNGRSPLELLTQIGQPNFLEALGY